MKYDRGILVDDHLRTSVRDIYAAGDVAALRNPQTGMYKSRAQWYDAVLQGRTVAAVITGQHELVSQPFGVPWRATLLGNLSVLAVGNLVSSSEGATILTDTSKKSYRRLSMIDDRLVGYLSLGPTQPDSLAIKRIIDEGLSIRDIKKALLKGNFDARKYFSEERSRVAHDIVTSGRLPVVRPTRVYELPTIHVWEEEVRPSTSLPDTFWNRGQTTPLQGEERTWGHPTPRIGAAAPMNPALLPSRVPSRSLWSYSDQMPAVSARHPSQKLLSLKDRKSRGVSCADRIEDLWGRPLVVEGER